jgi:hypothetical protein
VTNTWRFGIGGKTVGELELEDRPLKPIEAQAISTGMLVNGLDDIAGQLRRIADVHDSIDTSLKAITSLLLEMRDGR